MSRRIAFIAISTLLTVPSTAAPEFNSDFYSRHRFLSASPTVFQEGLLGFANPANLAFLQSPELQFRWSTNPKRVTGYGDWGFYGALPHVGFGLARQKFGDVAVTDYRIGTGFGSSAHASGLSYGWSSGQKTAFGRERQLLASNVVRPDRRLSLAVSGRFGLEHGTQEWVGEVGVRPLGNPTLTLFGDLAWTKRQKLENAPWSVGGIVQITGGVDLVGRAFSDETFTLGMTIGLGRTALASQGHIDSDGKYAGQSYLVRAGGRRPSPFPSRIGRGQRYLALHLRGRVDHLNYALFDAGTLRLYDLLRDLKAASDDPRVGVIALNLSSLKVAPEHAWELRHELEGARAAGKQIVVFIDRTRMTTYHLASVADVVVMDPQGMMLLAGYAAGRTYFQGTLAKLGLAFDEWRFFKYKSALETFSRSSMSSADREQYQAYVDDSYELTRADVGRSRGISESSFDSLVNDHALFTAAQAIEFGLVDTLARWSDLGDVLKAVAGRRMRAISRADLLANSLARETWGTRPRIALVYGLGVCDLDKGIRARWLERTFLKLARDPAVKAVVFRVDSPGGDGLASDLVAEAVRACSRNKPVIVSQGQVAGSGGYWISMYGDLIVAGPSTVTGSIGVIGGWIYDSALTERLGMSADHVQRGEHADFQMGVRLPLIGVTLPRRNLTQAERTMMEETIRGMYEEFLAKVASGRQLPIARVREIAEGHFYSGVEGKALGLVDEIGGLSTALAIALERAGLAAKADFEVVEYPRRLGLFDASSLRPSLESALVGEEMLNFIRMSARAAGSMLPLMPPGSYPQATE
jgi:protease-4